MKIPKKRGLWDLFIHIPLDKNYGLQKYRISEFRENPQNLFSSFSPKKVTILDSLTNTNSF